MNLIVIIVYNRLNNLLHWLECWKQCEQSAQLVVIHNVDNPENEEQIRPFKDACDATDVAYYPRQNIGFDIGAFQDVCTGRLDLGPWENILWCCDDLWPMSKTFHLLFWEKLKTADCVATEISPYVRRHIRTTGFALSRATAQRLVFPADPITTKEQCYHFEHRSKNTLLDQIPNSVMVAPQVSSPLFDTGYTRRLKPREREHYHTFGLSKEVPVIVEAATVAFVVPIYQNYPQIVSALICQTYKNWVLYLIHDGPGKIELPDDPRIRYIETPERVGNYGHSIRAEYLQQVAPSCDFVVISNPDNYYTPVFIEKSLACFRANPKAVATYCSGIIHNYTDYSLMRCRLMRGFIDCGQVMVRSKQAAEVGWNSMHPSSDWFYFNDIATNFGKDKFVSFPGVHFIHN